MSEIGTIHFARWVTPPNSPDVVFLSNYDSSWESYLEDFITRAHAGLTAIWSNSIGFPRTENLIEKGATDGERFKRFARRSMVPTRFWYSAYPGVTTTAIRRNADIRRGLSGAMTEDEAVRWLALFGSAFRPQAKLVNPDIQSLILGGLSFLPFGTCLLFDLPQDVEKSRRWLAAIFRHIAFNDGRRLRDDAIVTIALGPGGLSRLGLPKQGLETFPFAFLEGMATEDRARMLGDVGKNAPSNWRWGTSTPDVALLVYGKTDLDTKQLAASLRSLAVDGWDARIHEIPLKEVSKIEPFGFADGISQPVIRGTYKALRSADPIHIVEAGEFILGYPDNRQNLPPGPTLPATADPDNHLPLLNAGSDFGRTVVENTRDVGFNGSFLVIRELEQDVSAFKRYCRDEAERLKDHARLPRPYVVDDHFIGAKMIGRWRDGSSLVRHPYEPPKSEVMRYKGATETPERRQGSPNKMSMLESVNRFSAPTTARLQTHHAGKQSIGPGGVQSAENDFLFGEEDPQGLRCPFGAHVRRANPRDSFDPGSADQIAISNRHRILRVGRLYEPAPDDKAGLLFMCLNGDIERQFEFVQQTWLNSSSFHSLSGEQDPVLQDGEASACTYTIPTTRGPVRLAKLERFVTTRGGGYFFMPGKRLLEYLKTTT